MMRAVKKLLALGGTLLLLSACVGYVEPAPPVGAVYPRPCCYAYYDYPPYYYGVWPSVSFFIGGHGGRAHRSFHHGGRRH